MENSEKWFNGDHNNQWPSLDQLQFNFSNDQRTVTITHFENKKIGITFPEFLVKMQKAFEKKQEILAGNGPKNDLKWIVDNGDDEIDYYLENVTNEQLKADVYELIRKSADKGVLKEAIAKLSELL